MSADRITWVAHLVADTDSVERARALARALGLIALIDTPDKLMLSTTDGDVVEFCTPSADLPEYLFRERATVVGYRVDDLSLAAEAVIRAGFEPVSDPTDGGAVVFQHFRGIGGQIFGLIQTA